MKKKMFNFDPREYTKEFSEKRFVFIRKGVTEEFYTILTEQVGKYLQAKVLKEFALGNKQQSLFEFPDETEYLSELFEAIGAVCGLDPKQLVLSERHIKAYERDAEPNPLVHKDRYASEISVGLSIHVPNGSKLVLYPYDDVEVNSFNSAADLRASLLPDQLPEASLAKAKRVEYRDAPRDILIFRGNAIWHLRSKPAGATMLYLKLNAYNCDPLGEDPSSVEYRKVTQRALELPDEQLAKMIPMIGRRVDFVHRRYTRDWNEVIGVVLWEEPHLTIDKQELLALRMMDGQHTVSSVVEKMSDGVDNATGLRKIRRLAARGVIDLLVAVEQ